MNYVFKQARAFIIQIGGQVAGLMNIRNKEGVVAGTLPTNKKLLINQLFTQTRYRGATAPKNSKFNDINPKVCMLFICFQKL